MFGKISKLAFVMGVIGIPQILGSEIKNATEQIESYKRAIAGDDIEWLDTIEGIPVLSFIRDGYFLDEKHTPTKDIEDFIADHPGDNEKLQMAIKIEDLYRSIAVSKGQTSGYNSQSPWLPKIRFWQKMQSLLQKEISA